MSVVITAAVERGLRVAAQEVCQVFANQLAEKGMLNCKPAEALALLDSLEVTTKRSAAMKKVRAAQKSSSSESKKSSIRDKPSMLLPFCGEVEETWCKAVRFNHGLHTQCVNGPIATGDYCKTCQKSAENSASSKPTYGDIRDRLLHLPLEYRDPKGKLTTCYANVAKKQGLDIARAQEVAAAFGWTIPAEQLIETATKRGRPAKKGDKKVTAKKTKKAVVKKSNTMDDQIAQLVAEASAEVLGAEPDSLSAPAEKTIKVKAKKVKKVKKLDPVKEAEKLAKKQAAAELKAQKAAEKLAKKEAAEAKKQAAAELKAQKAAEKLAKKAAAEAKKQAAAELKAQKAAEKLAKKEAAEAKKQAAAELKAQKAAEKLAKKEAAEAKKQAAATKAQEQITVDSSDDEMVAPEPKVTLAVEESKETLAVEESKELDAEDTTFEADSSDEDEDELLLTPEMKVTIGDKDYFKTRAFGLPAVLFSYPTGEPVGALDEATGEIQEIEFDD